MSADRVFITGARGFIGRALAARLGSLGLEVRGVDLQADPSTGVGVGDISRPGPWQSQMRGCDLVIHTAALVSNAATADASWQLNVMGARHALDGAAAAGVRRFVHISSIRAFSDLDFPDGVDEHHPVRTDGNPYVDTKVASEQVVLQAHAAGEVPVTVIRPGDVYGPGSRPWTVLPVQAIKAGRFILPAHGHGVFSPIYVDTVAEGIVLAATCPEAAGQVLTLTDGAGVSCREFFGHYFRMLGRRGPVCVPTRLALALAAGSARAARLRHRETEAHPATIRYLARRGTYSIEKARRLLGFAPTISLNEGMERTEKWLRSEQLV
jgi:nucleoside-diphosphate-sugar epimerase